MKKILLFTLCLAAANVTAQETEPNPKLAELVEVMDMDSMEDAMYSQMELMMQNMSDQFGIKPDEQPIMDEYHSKMLLLVREELGWAKMKPVFMEIYDQTFTDAEVDAMLEFYKSDMGRSIVKKTPVVMQQSMQAAQGMMQNLMPKLEKIAQELQADLAQARQEKSEQ